MGRDANLRIGIARLSYTSRLRERCTSATVGAVCDRPRFPCAAVLAWVKYTLHWM